MKNKSKDNKENNFLLKFILPALISLFIIYLVLILIDLFFFNVQSWPYADGGSIEYVNVNESFFWIQYAQHCLYFSLKSINFILLFIGSIIVGLVSGLYFKNDSGQKKKFKLGKISFSEIYIPILISIVILSLIYFIFNTKFSSISYNVQLTAFFFIIISNLLVFSSMIKKSKSSILGHFIILMTIYIVCFLLFIVSSGCI